MAVPRPATNALHGAAEELRSALLATLELRAYDALKRYGNLPGIAGCARTLSEHLEGPRPVCEHLAEAGRELARASGFVRAADPTALRLHLDRMRAECAAAEACWRMARRAA